MKAAAQITRIGPSSAPRHAWLTMVVMMLAVAAAGQQSQADQQSKIYQGRDVWVEEITGSLPASPTLMVRVTNGNVTLQGGKQQRITYTLKKISYSTIEAHARAELRRYRLKVRPSGDIVVIEARTMGGHHMNVGGELTIQVPRSMSAIKLVSRGGNEVVTGIAGSAEVFTGGGNLRLDDIGGDIVASTAGGNVEVGNAGGNLMLKTGGGNVRINAVKGQIVTISGGGNIKIGSGAQGVVAQTAGGTIDVKHCGGEMKAQTGGGTIELRGLSRGAQVQSGGGRIVAEFLASSGFSGSSLETPVGDIIVYLSPGLKANIRAAIDLANGHRIRSDFSQLKVSTEGGQFGSKALYAEGNLNGGGPMLSVHTSSGDIEFRHAKK